MFVKYVAVIMLTLSAFGFSGGRMGKPKVEYVEAGKTLKKCKKEIKTLMAGISFHSSEVIGANPNKIEPIKEQLTKLVEECRSQHENFLEGVLSKDGTTIGMALANFDIYFMDN